MRKSRASSGLMRPHCTVRSCTIGRPYNSTFALATAEPREPDQCGSAYVVRVSAPASGSAHAGSICAEYRAHSRLVSTSSVLITHCGVDLATAEAGNRAKCVPRAP